jgi:hypothetical protein
MMVIGEDNTLVKPEVEFYFKSAPKPRKAVILFFIF